MIIVTSYEEFLAERERDPSAVIALDDGRVFRVVLPGDDKPAAVRPRTWAPTRYREEQQ